MKKNKTKKILKVTLYFILGIVILIILADPFCIWMHCYPDNSKLNATKSIHQSTLMEVQEESTYLFDSEDIISKVVKNRDDKNPYSTKNNAVRISTSNTKNEDVGYISLSASGSTIVIKSCFKKPCNEKINRHSRTVSIK